MENVGIYQLFVLFFTGLAFVALQDVTPECLDVRCPDGYECIQGACIGLPSTNVCVSNPCVNDCECVPSCQHSQGYYCRSPSGFIGKNCDIEIPRLNCSADKITVSVSSSLFTELFPFRAASSCLFIGQSTGVQPQNDSCKVCNSSNGYYTATILLPFSKCGATLTSVGDLVSYSNLLWAGLKDPVLYDIPVPILRFQCSYGQEYSVLTSLVPTIETQRIILNDSVNLKASVELCKIGDSCPNACPPVYSVKGGAAYTISETIHVTMSIQSSYLTDTTNALLLDEMHLACSNVYTDTIFPGDVSLIDSGCETSRLSVSIDRVHSIESVACVSFKVPRLLRCKESQFYIHAKLRIVNENDLPSCGLNRITERRLSKRSTENEDRTVMMVIPIRMIKGAPGISDSSVFPMSDIKLDPNPTIQSGPTFNHTFAIGAAVVACFLVLAIILSLYLYYRGDH